MAAASDYSFSHLIRTHYPALRRRAPNSKALPIFGSASEIRAAASEDYIDDGWGSFGNEAFQDRKRQIAHLDDAGVVASYGTLEPLGCGVYGCVYLTNDPRWVFKVTTDISEAHMVAILETLPGKYPGLVAYRGVYEIPNVPRRTFVLWREAADLVGLNAAAAFFADHPRYGISPFAMGDTEMLLYAVLTLGRDMFSIAERWAGEGKSHLVARAYTMAKGGAAPPTGSGKLGVYMSLLQAYESTCQKMLKDPLLQLVGKSLLDLFEVGITLNDLNANNVGITARSSPFLVVTDPGHVIPLDNRYQSVAPRSL